LDLVLYFGFLLALTVFDVFAIALKISAYPFRPGFRSPFKNL
jgi:hypothetical protein